MGRWMGRKIDKHRNGGRGNDVDFGVGVGVSFTPPLKCQKEKKTPLSHSPSPSEGLEQPT